MQPNRVPAAPVVRHAFVMTCRHLNVKAPYLVGHVASRSRISRWLRDGAQSAMTYSIMVRIIHMLQDKGVIFYEHGYATSWSPFIRIVDNDHFPVVEMPLPTESE